jgi:hypothetical protein
MIKVECFIALPCAASKAEIDEWVSFNLGHCGSMDAMNPLGEFDLESFNAPVLTDSKLHVHEHVAKSPRGYRHSVAVLPEPYTGPSALEQIEKLRKP